MKNIYSLIIASLLLSLAVAGCSSAKSRQAATEVAATADTVSQALQFSGDSALGFVKAQCHFGPRVPGTEAHRRCGDYLAAHMAACGANVIEQRATLTAFDGTRLPARNIIAEFAGADSTRRILLLAHWDCRPWTDHDPDPARRKEPVMGANDAASGVAVLMELARIFATEVPPMGIDLLLVDAEDWGTSDNEESWALGTQYWAKNPHRKGYRPQFGILLDMVGAAGAQFAKEYFSEAYAPSVVRDVWTAALKSGYGNYFTSRNGGGVTDDHIFVNAAGIPCIDIIDYRTDAESGFFPGWHTTADTPD
ncbi:MAG: M28 family peptidase, partial [Muribaculaceae bacterium]